MQDYENFSFELKSVIKNSKFVILNISYFVVDRIEGIKFNSYDTTDSVSVTVFNDSILKCLFVISLRVFKTENRTDTYKEWRWSSSRRRRFVIVVVRKRRNWRNFELSVDQTTKGATLFGSGRSSGGFRLSGDVTGSGRISCCCRICGNLCRSKSGTGLT